MCVRGVFNKTQIFKSVKSKQCIAYVMLSIMIKPYVWQMFVSSFKKFSYGICNVFSTIFFSFDIIFEYSFYWWTKSSHLWFDYQSLERFFFPHCSIIKGIAYLATLFSCMATCSFQNCYSFQNWIAIHHFLFFFLAIRWTWLNF